MNYETPQIVAEVGLFLREPIPRASEDMETHMIGLEALRLELAVASVDQLKLLHEKRKQMLWPKDAEKGMTELDRTTRLNADVAVIERDYNLIQKVEALVDWRLNCCMNLLCL